MGVAGIRTIEMNAVQVGEDFMEMVYVQPWRFTGFTGDVPNDDSYYHKLTIEVSETLEMARIFLKE